MATAKKKKAAAKKKPAAKAGSKTVAKVSPLRGTSVDDWAKRLDGWQADALRIIRALVKRHAPAATLSIKWGQPVWELEGPFAWARPAAKHFSFGFWRGAEMADPDGILDGSGSRMRHVKIRDAKHAASLPLAALVKEAVRLNQEKGDPTRR
jgi:hypothetical protein